jgi:hypothetical protein
MPGLFGSGVSTEKINDGLHRTIPVLIGRFGLTDVVSDFNVWCLANLLIRKHGTDAELEAARQQELMLERGNYDGRILWVRIRRAIEALQAPPVGKPH